MLVIAVVVLSFGALWWWGMKRRYREGRRLLPRTWLLLIGGSVLGVGAIGALFVLGSRPVNSPPKAGDDSVVVGGVIWLVIIGALVGGVLIRRRRRRRPQRTAEDVWNDTDPEFRKRSWNWWQGGWGGGSGGAGP